MPTSDSEGWSRLPHHDDGGLWVFKAPPQFAGDTGLRARVIAFRGTFHLHLRKSRAEWSIPAEDYASLEEAQAEAEAQVARIALLGGLKL